MNVRPGVSIEIATVPFLVCESGRRWSDAAKRFVGPFQHDLNTASAGHNPRPGESMFHVQRREAGQINALLADYRAFVILWEVSLENASAVALNIAQIGASRPEVMQGAALADIPERESKSLSLRIMELGASAILRSPQDLATLARLVRRRFPAPKQWSAHASAQLQKN